MTKIGLLSDTHSYLDPKIFEYFKNVDEIWHAGDIGTIELADELEKFKPLKAVFGNVDGHELRNRYPEVLLFKIENVKIMMMHIGGFPPKYNATSKKIIETHKPNLFISGHSHILKVIPDSNFNLLHINPGACGKHGWHKINTLIRFDIDIDKIKNLEVIEIGLRGSILSS